MSLSDNITFLVPPMEIEKVAIHTSVSDAWRYFSSGLRVWIVQTYMHLKDQGLNVKLDSEIPRTGIVIYSPEYRPYAMLPNLVTVAVRYDRAPQFDADFEVVQNGWFADGTRCFFIPHWTQPNLMPRDSSRGSLIKSIGYKGIAINLHNDFKTDKWLDFLGGIGVEWEVDYNDAVSRIWNDYRNVDLILAVRPNSKRAYYHKPASKLTNAWEAQVPAILGPEYAYRELRRSELDYLEVATVDEAIEAVTYLIDNPDRYDLMVENGIRRATEFSTAKVCSKWIELLTYTIPKLVEKRIFRMRRIVPKGYMVESRRMYSRMRSLRKRLSSTCTRS